MFKNKAWRIPVISTFTGIIISIISLLVTYMMVRGTNEWTLSMGDMLLGIESILAAILFLISGLFFLRDMSRKDILKSAAIVVAYNIIILVIQQLLLLIGQYPLIFTWIFIPVELYVVVQQLVIKFLGVSLWIGLIPSIIAPFLYVIFGKKDR